MEVLDTTIANVALRVHRRRPVGAGDRQRMGHHQLSRGQRDHPADLGLARDAAGRRNYFLLSIAVFTLASALVRHGHQPQRADRLPRAARTGRRRVAAVEPGDLARRLSAGEAGRGHDPVRHRGAARAGRRADARRLHHRQLRLALDLLPERAGRVVGPVRLPRGRGRSGVSAGRAEPSCAASTGGFDTLGLVPAERDHGLLGNRAEQGTGMGLVRRSVLPRPDAARCCSCSAWSA